MQRHKINITAQGFNVWAPAGHLYVYKFLDTTTRYFTPSVNTERAHAPQSKHTAAWLTLKNMEYGNNKNLNNAENLLPLTGGARRPFMRRHKIKHNHTRVQCMSTRRPFVCLQVPRYYQLVLYLQYEYRDGTRAGMASSENHGSMIRTEIKTIIHTVT
jgi:hypothetical protein